VCVCVESGIKQHVATVPSAVFVLVLVLVVVFVHECVVPKISTHRLGCVGFDQPQLMPARVSCPAQRSHKLAEIRLGA
jgi:hypothetical protein